MEHQRPMTCFNCLFCLHCLVWEWTHPVRHSQVVLTNVKYDFWLNWLFLFSGLQRFEKDFLYLCLNRSLESTRFRRVTNLAFSRRTAWCPPSSLPVPGAALPNEFGKQRKQKNRTTCERWPLHHTASFWKVSFRLLEIFWNCGQMRESSKGVPKWTKKEILKQLIKC